MKKFLLFIALCMLVFSANATRRYVDAAATGAGDGTSWADAYTTIAAALTASSSNDEVWVRAGTYNISATITAKQGVNVYGGFAGTETTSIDERVKSDMDANGIVEPWEFTNATIIKGAGTHLLVSTITASATVATVWNGVTLTNGATNNGAYAMTLNAGVTLSGSIVKGNYPSAAAGGTIYTGALAVSGGIADGCLIEDNMLDSKANIAAYGAGASITKSGIIKNSVVRNNRLINTSTSTNGRGGGIYLNSGGIAYNCVVYNNYCYRDGGGVYVDQTAPLINVVGGFTSPGTMVINTTVTSNECGNSAGGLYIYSLISQKLYNNIIFGNKKASVVNNISVNGSALSVFDYNAYNGGASGTLPATVNNVSNLSAANFVRATAFAGNPISTVDTAIMRAANWNITDSSALIDKATDTVAFFTTLNYSTDVLGNSRNLTACVPTIKKWDIGAYEYQKTLATIAWPQTIATLNVGDADMNLTATVSNGDTSIVYSSSNATVATISGKKLHVVGAGTATIFANYFVKKAYACQQSKSITVAASYTPSLSVSQHTVGVGAAASSVGSVDITTNFPFTLQSIPAWLTPDSTIANTTLNGSTSRTVTMKFMATANPLPSIREAKVKISSAGLLDSVSIQQAAGAATFSLSKTTSSLTFAGKRADGKNDTIVVTSNTSWTLDQGATMAWLTVTPTSGSGNAVVVISATAQTFPNPVRTATLTFTPTSFGSTPTATVTQAAAPAPGYIFVDGSKVDDSGDGKSWANAKKSIAAAIAAATTNRDTVCVKAGTYIITSTLAAVEGVNVYGGFAGTESNTVQRTRVNAKDAPWSFINATILDANNTATRILSSSNMEMPTRWDGFVMQNAKNVNPANSGGGAASLAKNMMLYNCILQNNSSTNAKGGGAVMLNRDAGLHNSLIQNNVSAGDGGGAFIREGTTTGDQLTISGCHFINNTAGGNGGGAIANYFSAGSGTFKISKCYIAGNSATGNAAAVFSNTGGTSIMLLEDCVITGHTVATGTAPAVVRGNNGLMLNRCLVTNNALTTAANTGILFLTNRCGMYNSVVANNTMIGGTQEYAVFLNSADAALVNTIIVKNNLRDVTGNAAAKLVNNIIQDNTIATGYAPSGALTNVFSGVVFRNSTSFVGAATTLSQAQELAITDWRPASATGIAAGTNLTASVASYYLGDLLLADFYAQTRPASGNWTIGAYNYASSLQANTIAWTQSLALDMKGTGNPKEVALNATATVAGAVRYTVDNPQVAYIENGNILKSFSPGTTTVRANHSGDATHAAAGEVAKTVIVTGDPSTLALSAATLNVAKTANSDGAITLSSNYGYIITYKAAWITAVTPASSDQPSTNRALTFTVTANPNITPRVDSVLFLSGGLIQKLVVTQVAGDPALSVSTPTVSLAALEGASATFAITSNTTWTIAGNAPWFSLSATSGTGNTTVTATATQENTGALRSASLTVSATSVPNVTVTVNQNMAVPATPIFVALDGDNSDGSTWAKAYTSIANALAVATNANKIYVKAGTYSIATALRSKAGVRVYGGFAGTESSESNRVKPANAKAWMFTNPTILEPVANVRVIDTTVLAQPAIWDGFTMQGARHLGATKVDSLRYGGVAHLRKNTFLNNCIIRNNTTRAAGGAIYMDFDARVYNSLLEKNLSLENSGAAVALMALTNANTYTPLVGNTIVDNKAAAGGGGVYVSAAENTFTGTLTLFNNYIARDTTEVLNGGGGGAYYNINAVCTIINDSCTFDRNIKFVEYPSGGTPGGGAVRTQGSGGTVIFNRCVFTNNHHVDTRGASALHTNSESHKMRIYNSLIQGNTGGTEAVQLRSASHIINSTIVGNKGTGIGFSSGKIYNNIVRGNGADLNPVTADPSNFANVIFVDSAAGNLHLAIGSKGVDKGKIIVYDTDPMGVNMLKKDFSGTARPQGTSYDPGMYEYVKVKPSASAKIVWTQDLSNLNISTTEQMKLTATVTGATSKEAPYLSPVGYISGDELTASVTGDTLVLMGTGTTTLTAHSKINPYYDTISMTKTVTVTGSNFLAVLPTTLNLGMQIADSVVSFKLNTDMAWTITNVPSWISLTKVSGAAGRAEIWVSIIQDNSLSAPRTATFTVATSSKSRIVTVKQDGLIFSISTTEINLASLGDSKDFNVSANLLWRADFEADSAWATLSPDNGARSATVYVTPKDNLGPERTGVIKVYTERGGVPTYTITVVQVGTKKPNAVGKETLTAFIYPNPTSDVLNISITEELNNAQLQIYNMAGMLVHTEAWSGRQQSVDISRLSEGMYFLQLNGLKGKVISAKILKK